MIQAVNLWEETRSMWEGTITVHNKSTVKTPAFPPSSNTLAFKMSHDTNGAFHAEKISYGMQFTLFIVQNIAFCSCKNSRKNYCYDFKDFRSRETCCYITSIKGFAHGPFGHPKTIVEKDPRSWGFNRCVQWTSRLVASGKRRFSLLFQLLHVLLESFWTINKQNTHSKLWQK